jgi:phage terminase small subunit
MENMKKSNKKSKKVKKSQKKGEKLTYKQQLFVDCYEGNGTEAARKAGYKGNDATLKQVGSENLAKHYIKKAIEKRQEEEKSKRNATRTEKLEILTELMRDKATVEIEKKDGATVLEIKVKPTDKIKAIEVHSKISGDLIITNKHTHYKGKSFKEGLDQVKKHFESHPDKEKLLLKKLEEIDDEE